MSATENVVALIGPPNSGKTTLFNWVTGSKFKTVNYPGSTIDYNVGKAHTRYSSDVIFIDTPGVYSLFPKSSDELVTHDVLFEKKTHQQIHHVVIVVDATQLARNLYLVRQLQEAGYSFTIALTMMDMLRKDQMDVHIDKIEKTFGCTVIPIDGTLGAGVPELVEHLKKVHGDVIVKKLEPWNESKRENILKELELLSKNLITSKTKKKLSFFERTAKIDRFLLHPVWGLIFFVGIMIALFSSIFWVAAPFMDAIDGGFSGLAEHTQALLGETLFSDFISNGIIAGFGAVLVFVPQIFILSFGIGLLEDSGYLARAATLIDKPFSKLGLNGRSFVPILSGFACAVPAMMASRTLSNKRERWITNFIIPLMTCSARLPVYALLLSFIFMGQAAWKPGLVLAALYFGALLIGALSAGILNKMLKKDSKSFFMLELPLYRRPHFRVVLKTALIKAKSYATRAGPIIFVLAVLIWGLSIFPNTQITDPHDRLEQSYFGQMGKVIEPVFEPMGVDWRVGVGLLSAFAAREVFVSTLSVIYNVGDTENEDSMQASLIEKMQNAERSDGQKVFTVASVASLLVFFMIALQCISTTGVAVREMRSWTFAITQLVVLNVVAYVLAVGVYQILS